MYLFYFNYRVNLNIEVGCYVAVRCRKYKDRPLIRKVAEISKGNVLLEWMIGTYSGTWRAWKGREGKRSVTLTDEIPIQDVLQGVQFTKTFSINCTGFEEAYKFNRLVVFRSLCV